MSEAPRSRVLIATGGTGGHVFPAQALAKELKEKGFEILFVGGKLNTNRYFKRGVFAHREISSATFSKASSFRALWHIGKGVWESFKILREFSPDLVIGFGSFYAFPILMAAKLKRSPMVLFESNAIPGKVTRLFSPSAVMTAVQFSEAIRQLKGTCIEVKMPTGERKRTEAAVARDYFYLSPERFTFLVFGGSQGAQSINHFFSEAIGLIEKARDQFQVIHVAGQSESAEIVRRKYEHLGIRSCVKVFEERMDLAWSAANLVVCRSGAATVAEQIAFEVPGILIPFPKAADDHQTKNAIFVEKQVGGAITCKESSLDIPRLTAIMEHLLEGTRIAEMRKAIAAFKQVDDKPDLCTLICKILRGV
jgi:UDP-N-acetylglucosamine--N-acetylmuramyl-(pentapeptide) pyrophosphoryl-undecaprenol N-acetylglucosamine transferase